MSNKTPRQRKRLLVRLAEAQGNLCFHCQKPMILPDPDVRYTSRERNDEDEASYDHLFPRNKGGKGGFNLVIAHRGCNSKKSNRLPTEAEIARLDALNELRKDLLSPEHGQISPASFGEITSSTIILAEVLNSLEGEDANRERHAVCRFVNIFYQDIKATDVIGNQDWQRIALIIRDHHLQKLYSDECTIASKNFVANVVHSMVKNRQNSRFCKKAG